MSPYRTPAVTPKPSTCKLCKRHPAEAWDKELCFFCHTVVVLHMPHRLAINKSGDIIILKRTLE